MLALAMFMPQSERYKHMNPEVVDAPDENMAKIQAYHEARKLGGRHFHIADTGSMKPTMFGNEYLAMQKGKYDDLKKGQIVMYCPKWAVEGTKMGHPLNIKSDGSQIIVDRVLPGRRVQYKTPMGETKVIPMDELYAIVTHRLVQKDKAGWIASGDSNKHSENFERITPDNYFGTVLKIYTHPKSERHKKKGK